MSVPVITIGSWTPGIGDPSFMGWFTVFSYYVAAVVCLAGGVLVRKPMEQESRIFWIFMFAAMVLLGLQKQFNLLSACTEIGRMIARLGAWTEDRRIVQAWAMGVVFLTAVIVAVWAFRRFAPASGSGRNKMAVFGLGYLTLFVLLRGISLHQFGTVLSYEIAGARINWIAELFGICWIALAALWPEREACDSGNIHRKRNQ